MIKAFKKHLNLYFLFFPKTKKLKEFKEELLGVLMERYEDLVAGGMDKDRAYAKCIDSIEDYKDTIEHIAEQKSEDLTVAQRKLILMGSIVGFTIVLLLFFVLSINFGFNYSWLTWIGGVVVSLIIFGFYFLRRAQRNSRFMLARLAIPIIVLLIATTVYLIVSFALKTQWHMTWLAFVVVIPVWYMSDILYRIHHKVKKLNVFDWLIVSFTVTLCVYLLVSFITTRWSVTWVAFLVWLVVASLGIFGKYFYDYVKLNNR